MSDPESIIDFSDHAPLEDLPTELATAQRTGLSLFWRTFFLLSILLLGNKLLYCFSCISINNGK